MDDERVPGTSSMDGTQLEGIARCVSMSYVVAMPVIDGAAIRTKRLERGLGLQEFARASGVDAGNLSRIERGKSSAHMATLRRIAAALDLAVSDIASIT
jgi:predicted transcriptional regulator